MRYYFMTSYASEQDRKWVARFHTDLERQMRAGGADVLVGGQLDYPVPGSPGVRADGDHPAAKLPVMVALYSDSYFSDPRCALDWEIFNQRGRIYSQRYGKWPKDAVIGLIWRPVAITPVEKVLKSQSWDAARGAPFAGDGLFNLMRRHHDDYHRVVERTANRILEAHRRLTTPGQELPSLSPEEVALIRPPSGGLREEVTIYRQEEDSAGRRERLGGSVPRFIFFTSYAARPGDRELVEKLHADLTAELGVRADREPRPRGFLAPWDIGLGAEWQTELREAARTIPVMVALLSDDYFRSGWCGWEWAVFSERMRRAAMNGAASTGMSGATGTVADSPPGYILPLEWVPRRQPVPAVARRIQLTSPSLGRAYADSCVVDLMRQHPREYQSFIIALAEKVLRTAAAALPPLDRDTAAGLAPAFGDFPAPNPPVSPGPPVLPDRSSKPAVAGSAGKSGQGDSGGLVAVVGAGASGRRDVSGGPGGGGLGNRLAPDDILALVEALERVDVLYDQTARQEWVVAIGHRSGRQPRPPLTPHLRTYFMKVVRFAGDQADAGVLTALADALHDIDPGSESVHRVRTLVEDLRTRW
ncbi:MULTISPECIES: TIR domain-containing protein [unclassified Frankia]|uniref:TIR domain-containing protein n=1 Tax=unclassified Frankia TaxID=2632575 RepID=UPI0020252007